jgi:hypothetical protein
MPRSLKKLSFSLKPRFITQAICQGEIPKRLYCFSSTGVREESRMSLRV